LESWSAGIFTGKSIEETAQLNAKALGQVHALEDLLEMTFDDFYKGEI